MILFADFSHLLIFISVSKVSQHVANGLVRQNINGINGSFTECITQQNKEPVAIAAEQKG